VRTVGSGDSSTVVNIQLIIMAIVLKSNGSLKTKIELTSAHSSKRKKN